ncbi:universal stress protein [Oceaniglobus ichthyenteri]|uniref:universal stress protein n=1 Tax=Oceaniglobus ichthyenteri TaxID=2136177 RepID=UPI000D396D9D|nr:universal stress protein [Oceaniglobus ichthyenteri]
MPASTILAAVGQFPQDTAVLARAVALSVAHGARLHVVHILDLPESSAFPGDVGTLFGQAEIAARDTIKAALAELDVAPDRIEIHIEAGAHALRLIEICEHIAPDLIVMRAHQKTKISQRILGSTTERVIAAGLAPVLVVKQMVGAPYARVIVATNGNDDAQNALGYVANLLPDAKLHLVQVVRIAPQLEEAMLRVGTRQSGLIAHRRNLTRIAKDHLHSLTETIGPRATSQAVTGAPDTVLARLCRNPGVDLIALGPGRASLIHRAFIGSVSRRLLRDAACDVLICTALPKSGLA